MKKVLISLFTIILVFSMTTVAFAANSPIQEIIPDTAVSVDGVVEEASATKVQVTKEQEANTFTFVAPEKDGYVFNSWNITGEYVVVTGGLDKATITIKLTDPATAKVVADYTAEEPDEEEPDEDKKPSEKPSEKPSKKPDKGPANDSPTAPDTGSDAIAYFGLTALIAASIAVTSKKRMK